MQGYGHSTLSSSHNAFSPSFLQRISKRDEPPPSGEADAAGPWRILEVQGGGFGLFRMGESPDRGSSPAAVFRDRWLALLAAAVLPGTGRDAAFHLHKERGSEGFTVEAGNGGEALGSLTLFDERLVEALHVAEGLLRSPESLANLLEAAGQIALERAGAVLDERIP
jgi:hypothetical protein